jgi:hypothetical protein
MHGLKFECAPGEVCQYISGEEVIANSGLDRISMKESVLALFCYIIITRMIGYFGLRFSSG